ncbi:CRISPR-associated helicase/endonuclease Cas3 [Streptomyces calidiresistens]|uniref:CRISPR-associated helicase Cas3 n=1 Tax=Streptomyces calidiresistens TaxID=1485586 RepID=A0A7W3T179_9ACTN|nr:CRISPR-associated helicase Cas3' [Streptomyces calidiresistens]MBB0229039.1 CRISPR-associated helicase Cas3' [Streptomyces calidiresistens]
MVDVRLHGKSEGLVKPYPVIGHLIDSAMVCGAVWGHVLSEGQRNRISGALGVDASTARQIVMFWAGLHDLGKIMPQFQDMILEVRPDHRRFLSEDGYAHDRQEDAKAGRTRHENATHAALPQLLLQLGYPATGGRLAKLLAVQVAQILGGHHGRYPSDSDPRDLRDPSARMPELGCGEWAEQRQQHTEALHEVLGRPAVPDCRAMPVPAAVVVAGMVIVSDWIASQEHVIEVQQKLIEKQEEFGSLPTLRLHARNAERMAPALVEDAGLGRATFKTGGFHDLFPRIRSPYPLQLSVAEGLSGTNLREPGILLVTAPTGDGKTETALYAASLMGAGCGSAGLFFALPTQATANQMYGRLVEFAERNLLDSASLTLLHGAAELYLPYTGPPSDGATDVPEPRVLSDCEPGAGREARVSVEAGRWLRSRGRGILAPLAVGTIDQALMGVLPLKRNALRHLGLAGKTVIVDEAHAYDAYTHALLLRLLEWLGALGVPVVLLSATLTGDIARGLVRSYLAGAEPSGASREVPVPAYPGWLYASARDNLIIEPPDPLRSERERELVADVRRTVHTYDPDRPDGRLAAVLDALDGVADGGGCAAVICTTVAEAQQTYEALREHYRSRYGADYLGWDDRSTQDGERQDSAAGPRLRLLHARFPAWRRTGITAEVESWFGRTDKPGVCRPTGPRGAVLVATQVIEQSLDLDFDLMVSDLAPMAMLLQRAGRIWRHLDPAPPRPAWALAPRLVVLAPVGRDGHLAVPKTWGEVYQPSLLQRTLELLDRHGKTPITVPDDVQSLVDEVYAEEFTSVAPDKLMERDFRRLADDMARSAMADMVALPPPHRVTSLYTLTTSDADEELVRTRLGADSVQVLPVFENGDGQWLDRECSVALPEFGRGREGRFIVSEVRDLLSYVAPLAHGSWRQACGPANEPPVAWSKEPRLARIVLLPQRVTGDEVEGAMLGEHQITYNHELGLIVRRSDSKS